MQEFGLLLLCTSIQQFQFKIKNDKLMQVKKLLELVFLVMLLGIGLELMLLGHTEDGWQILPLALIIFSIMFFILQRFSNSIMVKRLFMATMGSCILSGFVGMGFHLNANMEFESEMKPGLEDFDLLQESLTGALPSLSPGSMIVLGMVGYAYFLLKSKNQN